MHVKADAVNSAVERTWYWHWKETEKFNEAAHEKRRNLVCSLESPFSYRKVIVYGYVCYRGNESFVFVLHSSFPSYSKSIFSSFHILFIEFFLLMQ